MLKVFYLSLIVFFSACSMFSEKKADYDIKYPPELEKVQELIVENKTSDARLKVDDYLNRSKNIHWFGHAYFLKAFLFEMDEKYPQSIKTYRQAIQHSAQYNAKVEAKALYNLSFVFERTKKMDELLTSLIDLMKRREFFDILTGQVEIPARLAAAYASENKMKEAKIFHREASQNFRTLIRSNGFRNNKEEISKSLYYLGFSVYDGKNETYDSLISKLSYGEKYYLAAAEASQSSWSQKATDRLLNQFDQAWGLIQGFQPTGLKGDPLAQKKQKHERQLAMASDLYDLMHRLRAEEFPLSNVNKRSRKIMKTSQRWIGKIENFAQSLNLGPEMIRNKKIKNTKLTRFIEEKKKPVKIKSEKTVSPKQSLPVKDSSSEKLPDKIGKDPNL